MKKWYSFLILALISINVMAQTGNTAKQDVIQKLNGEEMKGKVIKITDTEVTFIYAGETAEYVINKSEIGSILHSSGRVERISQQNSPAENRQKDPVNMSASPADHHNKIAILPFDFIMDNQSGAEAIGYKSQEEAYGLLSQHAAGYTILDPRTTNALLNKAGLTKDKMINFTMKEICDILGVEYVIVGAITQNKGYQTSSSSDAFNTTVKRNDNDKVKGVSTYGSTNSNSVQRYDVSVSLHIYMDNNASIYNQTHKAFFSNTDGSYSSPLEYLLKRSP